MTNNVGLSAKQTEILVSALFCEGYHVSNFDVLAFYHRQFFPNAFEERLPVISELEQLQLLCYQNDEISLTDSGRRTAKAIKAELAPQWYSRVLEKCAYSEAYAKACLKIQGHDVKQFSMLSKNQFDFVAQQIKLNHSNSLLDVGCGNGGITSKLAQICELDNVVAVDSSDNAIELAKKIHRSGKISFESSDMDTFETNTQFDFILFVDSIYFSSAPIETIKKYSNMLNNGGMMCVFYCGPKDRFETFEKRLAHEFSTLLSKNFTDEYEHYWDKVVSIVSEMKEEFINEGSEFFYQAYLEEAIRHSKYQQGPELRKAFLIKRV